MSRHRTLISDIEQLDKQTNKENRFFKVKYKNPNSFIRYTKKYNDVNLLKKFLNSHLVFEIQIEVIDEG